MTLKLQPYEKKFLENLREKISVTDEDVTILFKIWRRKFGGRRDKATSVKMPRNFFCPVEFFRQSEYFSVFIQNGKCYDCWEEVDFKKQFLNLRSSCFISDHGAPVYLLYGYTPKF